MLAIQDYKWQKLVSIRDYYLKDGKRFPTARGISLTAKQWSVFRNSLHAIDEAVAKMESRKRSEDVGKPIEGDISDAVNCLAPQGLLPVERNETHADMPDSVTPHGNIPTDRKQVEVDMSDSATDFSLKGHNQHNSSMTAASPQRLIPIETIRLNGRNYHCWMHQIEFFLKQLKIAYVLTEPCPSNSLSQEASIEEIVEARASAQKWKDDDYICHHNILNSLSDHLFDQYSKKTCSSRELWEELKLVYNEDFGTKRSQVNKYIQFQMVDGISILEQVQELHKIADSIIASGMCIDENFHVSVIISKLPPSWKDYRTKLLLEEVLPLHTLICRLRVEEESRNRCKKENPSKNANVVEARLENKLGPRKREMKKLCYTCGKEGHISRYCHHNRKVHATKKSKDEDNGDVPAITEVNRVEGNIE
ncbi:unnamed protein product [Ilex paraguariensis]|uniref:CCHC-type domain-containing protein n=1 Tax=Ilex paraguariensis TaxID=185542 RepID=A0ABC8QVZ0_9AQUA